ncbi:uncharacterized protein LOC122626304 [Drosophila teissieri]|uniref:uncharacterized protein LOC122626304 n=1 Tax=Drosophila teissieri TaxID=7243 RepID=UPI001CBA3ADD|nr:uncharacterized protein LOC122626304 [Drosophila teissieri]XP_043662439.1 uncharacterized protein LOC122626304 [Drosophila teissieri]
MPSVKSAESEILLGIIRSDSMTSGNTLRSCLLLATILGLFCRTKALPFEYVDEHDDFNYDLDTAQSQAKYDARLLSQQMLSDAELQRQGLSDAQYNAQHNALDGDSTAAQGTGAGSHLDAVSSAQEDLEPHSRAAACFTNGHKYTHGQKVPRLDACEVCLCMDGEIFCWWEKCDRANVNKARKAGDNVGLGLGVGDDGDGDGDGDGDDDGDGDGDGDYSDPYGNESTTGKSTKVHKAARKVGKRHKHHKNQKNFNDYEVYHSQRGKQLQHQQPDYKKSAIMQQLQIQQKHKSDKSGAGNYNIIKQHKHQQQQQLKIPQQLHQQQQQKNVAALGVNHAAKATHYQQAASTALPPPQPPPQPPHPQHSHHPHQQPHSSSKILNFPENLPALLYYDYKTEEHEHHQHQHHQQHLLHEKQRLLQQQQQQLQQEALARQRASEAEAEAAVAPSGGLAADKNSDEAETDSDILPEPPTKQPKAAATQWPTPTPTGSNSARALMTSMVASTPTAATTTATKTSKTKTTTATVTGRTTTTTATGTNEMVTSTLSGMEKSGATVAGTDLGQMQPDHRGPEAERDDAFHRWLTSTELNADNTNSMDDSLERETPASTIIDDVGTANKSDRSIGGIGKDNGNDAVFFRSSYNDYSSEFNGSVVNIDITLTAVDVHPRRQTDLIANGNKTSGANDNGNGSSSSSSSKNYSGNSQVGAAGTTMNPQAASSISSISSTRSSSNQDQRQQSSVVPPYTLTTIITTAPLAPGRMCNVLGKLYKIGDILPQDTGNCLQCICTDAVTPDEMPSVTCSPHNCPPLVLPDLFDATGY